MGKVIWTKSQSLKGKTEGTLQVETESWQEHSKLNGQATKCIFIRQNKYEILLLFGRGIPSQPRGIRISSILKLSQKSIKVS